MLFFVYQVSEAGSVCLLSLLKKKVCSLSLVKHAFPKICAEHLNKPRTKRAPYMGEKQKKKTVSKANTLWGKAKIRKGDTMKNQ